MAPRTSAGTSTRWVVACWAAALTLLAADARGADPASASLGVRVRLADDTPLGATAIRLEPDGRMGAAWEVRTGADGTADLPLLPPGAYRITIAWRGRRSQSVGMTVVAGERAAATLILDPTVADAPALRAEVEHHRETAVTLSVDDSLLRDLPHGDTATSVVETILPSAISARLDTGGTATGSTPIVGSTAASWTQTTYQIDGTDVTDDTFGGLPLVYPAGVGVARISVTSGLLPIEVDAPGPLISLASRPASSSWRTSAAFAGTPSSWTGQSASTPPRIESLSSWAGVAFDAGGPLGARVGLALSGTLARSRQRDRDDIEFPGDVSSLSAALTASPADARQLDLAGVYQQTADAWPGRRLADRTADERNRFAALRAGWRQMIAGSTMVRLSGSYERRAMTPEFGGPAAPSTIERLRDGPVPALAWWGDATHARWSASATLARSFVAGGSARHSLRAGGTITRAASDTEPVGLPPIAETVGGVPARVWQYDYAGRSHWSTTTFAAFAADEMRLTPALRLEAALGIDRTDGSAEGSRGPGLAWISWSPRMAMRWQPRNGPTSLLAGYARYHARAQLAYLAFGDRAGPLGDVYRWTDENQDGAFSPDERGIRISRVGPGTTGAWSRIDPGVERPAVDEYVLGIERAWSNGLHARLVGIARRGGRQIQPVNVGVPNSRYSVRYQFDRGLDAGNPADDQLLPVYDRSPESFGQDEYLLTNADTGIHAEGLDLAVWQDVADRFRILAGASVWGSAGPAASRGYGVLENDPGMIGEVGTDPNAATHANSRFFFDRAYVVKLSGSYRARRGLTIGVASRYQDGQPFARMVVVPDLNQGPDAIRAYENGESRFTYTLTVDARLRQSFHAGRAALAVVLDVFNLLDTSHEVAERSYGDAFRTPTVRQPGRVVRLGIHADF